MQDNMEKAIANYMDAINADYQQYLQRTKATQEYKNRAGPEFENGLNAQWNKKYVRITTATGSVHSFIVNVDNDNKFRKGDILKPAGYATPARNSPRGNILDGGYTVHWTGPYYLKG